MPPLIRFQTFKNRVETIFENIKELLNEPDTDENVANIREILGEPKERSCQYLLAAGFYGRVGLLKILIDEIPVSLLQNTGRSVRAHPIWVTTLCCLMTNSLYILAIFSIAYFDGKQLSSYL